MTRLRADLFLLCSAVIWGACFVAQKDGGRTMAPLSFVGARFLLSALVLAPLAYVEARRAVVRLSRKDLAIAGLAGLCLFAGSGLQQIGLKTTTATNAGFLTALYVVLVPFVVWMLDGVRPRAVVAAACGISIWGAWLLADHGQTHSWSAGDLLVALADVAWAVGIALMPAFLNRTHRPFFMCFVQYGVTAALGLMAGSLFEHTTRQGLAAATPAILYAALASSGVAYTLSVVALKHTPAAEAALIMSLESVFAAVTGALLLHERLTAVAMMGCAFILLGVIVAEIGPAVLRRLAVLSFPASP